jgi:anti-sigma B factor antagonist
MLDIQTKQLPPDVTVLEVTGRITLGRESKQLEWAVDSLVGEGRNKAICNLGGVTAIDSTGIGILVMCAGKLKNTGGELRLAGATAHVEEVLKLTNINQILGIYPTVTAAAADF